MKRETPKMYSLEYKKSSAKLAIESEKPITKTARDLGVSESTLYGWVNKYESARAESKSTDGSVNAELKRLEREVARLKQERDILKKAAAYFAKEM